MTIFRRLTFGYASIMVLVVFLGGYSTLKLNQINRLTYTVDAVDGRTIRLTEHIYDSILSRDGFGKKFLVSGDPDFHSQYKEMEAHIAKDLRELSLLMSSPEKWRIFVDLKQHYDQYVSLYSADMERIETRGEVVPGKHLLEKNTIDSAIGSRLREIVRIANSDRDRRIAASSRISSQVLWVTGMTASLIVLAGLLISFFTTRSINRSVHILKEKTKEIATGKFEEIIDIASPPEIKELAEHFNIMCRRLKELDEMKIDFISHVSHELRTPLTVIRETSGMLLEGVYAGSPDKERDLLIITQEECERLIASVNRILDLSRMEAGMMSYHFTGGHLKPLVEKCVTKMMPIARTKKIRLEVKAPAGIPQVNIDELQIEQVFENILGNALKFSLGSNGNRVVVGITAPTGEPGFIQVSVSDTGPGISAEDLEIIFDKFQRIQNGMETVRGTGLGLSIVKHIITAHGGRIWVESKPAEGCTFHFTLPVYSESC